MSRYANNLVEAMAGIGLGIEALAPAFPGRTAAEIEEIQRDNALALSRPLLDSGLLGVHPCNSRYFNIAPQGFRSPGETQPWPPTEGKKVVYFFGGSTTLGHYVEDAATVPAGLRRHLLPHGYEVYNFGSGNYTSRMGFQRFLLEIADKPQPDLVVFMDGFNDGFYAINPPSLRGVLDNLFQAEKRRRGLSRFQAILDYARTGRDAAMPTAIGHDHGKLAPEIAAVMSPDGVAGELARSAETEPGDDAPALEALAEKIWNGYLDTLAMTRAFAGRRGIRTLHVWQPCPFHATEPGQRILEKLYPAFAAGALCGPLYRWLKRNDFPGRPVGADFLDLSDLGRGRDEVLYLDVCHYSSPFGDVIGKAIAEAVLK